MIYKVEYTTKARNHLLSIFQWMMEESPSPAPVKEWLGKIEKAVASLTENPNRCPIAPEGKIHKLEIRHLIFGKRNGQYRILFTIQNEKVIILDIRHASRQWLTEKELN